MHHMYSLIINIFLLKFKLGKISITELFNKNEQKCYFIKSR